MADRFRLGLWQLFIAIDQLIYIIVAWPIYSVFGGRTPSADETISSRVGRAAIAGARWGLVLEQLIDGIAVLLGREPGHCRRNVEPQFQDKPPTA